MNTGLCRPTALAFALALGIVASASAATTPAITAFDEAFSRVNDYTVTVTAHEVQGGRTQNRTYHYAFKRPNMVKADIVSGDGAGSGGVWRGGDTVKGHLKIAFFTVGKTLGIHDPRATSLRGYTIADGLLQNQVDKYKSGGGKLSQRSGPLINGIPTQEIDLKIVGTPPDGVTRSVMYLSNVTRFPVRQVRYAEDTVVTDETFSDLKINVGLTDKDFPF